VLQSTLAHFKPCASPSFSNAACTLQAFHTDSLRLKPIFAGTVERCAKNFGSSVVGDRLHCVFVISAKHQDPFAHGDERQLSQRRWYFHRVGKGYKGGTYKVR